MIHMEADIRIPQDRYEPSRIHDQLANEPTVAEIRMQSLKVAAAVIKALATLFQALK